MKFDKIHADGATCILFEFERTLDHAQVVGMAEVVKDAIEQDSELRLLLDLRKTETFELGAFLSSEGFLTSVRSIGPVSRYAVVGAPAIAAAAVESFGSILPLDSRAFDASEIIEARNWVLAAAN
ncbi:MAG: STAS/SEC14 domain-containing protein [Erythrobacter sp.]|uniref:STAS/SEC14 domain-containing protein n=1 Tax=Erythrobacter sp. TaxID=1042 RepID=UPI0025F8F36C|nr:STAS/SEC14 domain-containing protein [Erythrobacter sp.]MCL9999253.1 STAS/SEC14 domain-containing protein [Erythrobacter sp.]